MSSLLASVFCLIIFFILSARLPTYWPFFSLLIRCYCSNTYASHVHMFRRALLNARTTHSLVQRWKIGIDRAVPGMISIENVCTRSETLMSSHLTCTWKTIGIARLMPFAKSTAACRHIIRQTKSPERDNTVRMPTSKWARFDRTKSSYLLDLLIFALGTAVVVVSSSFFSFSSIRCHAAVTISIQHGLRVVALECDTSTVYPHLLDC